MFSLHLDTAVSWRGGQNQVLLTVRGLCGRGDRAALVAHPDGELRRRAEGLEVVPLAPRSEVDLRAAWRLSRVIRTLAPDIVHAHDPHALAMAALARSLSRGLSVPLVAARRVDFHLSRNAFSRWKYQQLDMMIAASEAIRRMMIGDGFPADRIVTVHEGIEVARVADAPPVDLHKTLWLPAGAPIVGHVGALVAHKGQRHLIEAAPLVLRQVPDARFVIVGEGELRESLERQIHHLGIDTHVFLTGFRPDVPGVLKGFDLFVMCSTTEGLGTSVLDAMASGLAVVGTNAGGIPESVADGETGLIVSTHDHRALAAAIVRLLQDSALRARMGAAGRARAGQRFSVERMVAETADVYRQLLSGRVAPRAPSPPRPADSPGL
ncbi:MAG TPA: glycosyltransferase family 4 protein [Vicinamibacterales bacterium]|jgi:glycosyltransferase involved in cell wall biosynthesis